MADEPTPQKSSPLKWILLGCGCITLVGVAIVGIGGYFGYKLFKDMSSTAENYIRAQPEIEKEIGAVQKVELDAAGGTEVSRKNDSGTGFVAYRVTGARGSGVAKVWMDFDPNDKKWKGRAIVFTTGEKMIKIGDPPGAEPPAPKPPAPEPTPKAPE